MIKFLDLKKINLHYENAFQNKLKNVLDSGWYILGNEVKLFEENFAAYCDSKYCIGVGNGYDALTLIFKGYIQLGKMQKGDEVIVPANTYIATILSVLQADLGGFNPHGWYQYACFVIWGWRQLDTLLEVGSIPTAGTKHG